MMRTGSAPDDPRDGRPDPDRVNLPQRVRGAELAAGTASDAATGVGAGKDMGAGTGGQDEMQAPGPTAPPPGLWLAAFQRAVHGEEQPGPVVGRKAGGGPAGREG